MTLNFPRLFCIAVLILPAASAMAAEEIYATVEVAISPAQLDELSAAGFNISNYQGGRATLTVTAAELADLRARGHEVSSLETVATKAPAGYLSFASVTSNLVAYTQQYPTLTRLESVGKSVLGRELWVIHLSRNVAFEEDEPEFKYISTMHGDEPIGTDLCMRFIEMLLAGYGIDSRITALLDSTSISVMPIMNPDGYEAGQRFNHNGVDLNRAFPEYPAQFTRNLFDGEPLHIAGRQREVDAVMRWTARQSYVLSANLHTGALLVNYPYDDDGKGSGNDAPTPDDLQIEHASHRYASANPPMYASSVFPGGISNGSKWFAILGGMMDWNYRYVSCTDVTIELSNVKAPASHQLPAYWSDNRESMLAYLEEVHRGVRGIISERVSGAPVYAKIVVLGNAHPVFTDPDRGDFHRMLLPGTYTLGVMAPDFSSATLSDVQVGAGPAVRRDAVLDLTLGYSGDVNGDGFANAIDTQLVRDAANGAAQAFDCDLDDSGAINHHDASLAKIAALWP